MNWLYKLFNTKINGEGDRELPFKPGSIVIVKHDLFSDPVISIIQETDENYIYLAYPNEFKGSGIKVGNYIECRVLFEDMEYVVNCRINNINMFYPMYLHLYVENISAYESKRDSKRFLVDYDAYCVVPFTGESVTMTAKNISKSGLYMSIPKRNLESYESFGDISAEIVTNDNETVSLEAKVVRTLSVGRFNEFGMQITNINENNRLVYEKVINKLEDELGSLVLSYIMSGSNTEF